MALALALVRCRCLLVGFDSPPLPLPFPVTPALLTTLLLPVRGGPITPRRTPTLPVTGRFLTRRTAIPRKRMGRLERPFTSLQQADMRPPASGTLNRTVG